MIQDYVQARKLGMDAIKKAQKDGTDAYLKVLDNMEEAKEAHGNIKISLIEIPLSRVVGTKTEGRNNAFAFNFMPLLEQSTEFATKWSALYDSYVEEGIQNPIECFEYMNHYYVQEGNKRVSVSKYGGSVFIPANVTRLLPPKSDDPRVVAYYEYLKFYDVTGNHLFVFTNPGEYEQLAAYLGQTLDKAWPEELRNDLKAAYFVFEKNCRAILDNQDDKAVSSAFLTYLSFYPMSSLFEMSDEQIIARMKKAREELLSDGDVENIEFVEEAPKAPKVEGPQNIINTLFPGVNNKYTAANPLNVAFIFNSSNTASGRWLDSHEAGKIYVDERCGDNVVTKSYFSNPSDGSVEKALGDAVYDGCQVIFTVSSYMLTETVKCAIEHPDIKFFNCSVGKTHPSVRCYHGKLYEASFLMGVLAADRLLQISSEAGAGDGQTRNVIGYVARNTANISIANMNAFAIGVSLIDPNAKVKIIWNTLENSMDYMAVLKSENIRVYADIEYSYVYGENNRPGVYVMEENNIRFLGAPYYNWGKYYLKIVEYMLEDGFKNEKTEEGKTATNYWFGLSTGVVDIITAADLPYQTCKLLSFLKSAIISGGVDPFSGEIHSQNGLVSENTAGLFEVSVHQEAIGDGNIATLDWLNENIEGELPKSEE